MFRLEGFPVAAVNRKVMEASLAHLTDNEMGFHCLFNLWLPDCLRLHSSNGSGHAALKVYRALSPALAPPGKPGYPRLSLPLLVLLC